jgi:hypothetical protein
MAGAYCKFCDRRCFVYRELPDGSWCGHMATCRMGMQHDREQTGYDHTTAINPYASEEPHA